MREQLIQYVELLFAGAENADDIRQEILQNTLDRYDDLVSQGKSPEAAYRLAISGIGDIREILGDGQSAQIPVAAAQCNDIHDPKRSTLLRAVAICLYILCPIPLFILQNVAGLCILLVIVAIATMLLVFGGTGASQAGQKDEADEESGSPLYKAIRKVIGAAGLCIYLIVSFVTEAWHITWLIFPIMAAVQGLVKAILELREAN